MRNGAYRKKEARARTVGQFVNLFLRRSRQAHKDGTPGAFSLRFYVVEHEGLKPHRVEIGLRTNKRREAAERALVVISGLLSTARLWLPDRTLNMLMDTDLPLWFPLSRLNPPEAGRYSSKGKGAFSPPRENVAAKPRA